MNCCIRHCKTTALLREAISPRVNWLQLNYLFFMMHFNFFLDSCKSALGFYESQSVTIDLFHNVYILGLRLFGTLPIAIGYFRRLERSSVLE